MTGRRRGMVVSVGDVLAVGLDTDDALRLAAGDGLPATVGRIKARNPGGWRGLPWPTPERIERRRIVSRFDVDETIEAVTGWARIEHLRDIDLTLELAAGEVVSVVETIVPAVRA